jgi:hypothetical protein
MVPSLCTVIHVMACASNALFPLALDTHFVICLSAGIGVEDSKCREPVQDRDSDYFAEVGEVGETQNILIYMTMVDKIA